ncbi:MAG: hypothetical protein K6F52_08175 [Clostridia bacterium]|nr:hypothetical protein [Clostridia bacterium]
MDRCRTAFSAEKDFDKAFEEVTAQLEEGMEGMKPIVLFFDSDAENFAEFALKLKEKYPDTVSIGSSSYMSFSSKGYSKHALVAMAIYDGVECVSGIIREISRYPMRYAPDLAIAVARLGELKECCCIEFTTAFSHGEELVLDTFKSVLADKDIPLFGGSAGAAENQKTTYVALNGEVFTEACVYIIIKNLKGGIHLYKENMFTVTNHFLVATDVDCDRRTVYEYDNKPAAEVIANALKVPVSELAEHLWKHPIGRVKGDNVYITDSDTVMPDGSISYYTRIYSQTKLAILEKEDIDTVWEKTAAQVRKDVKNPSFTIVINCLSRTKTFLDKERFDDFANKLEEEYGPYIAISGYGEQLDFEHLNRTMVLAVFD